MQDRPADELARKKDFVSLTGDDRPKTIQEMRNDRRTQTRIEKLHASFALTIMWYYLKELVCMIIYTVLVYIGNGYNVEMGKIHFSSHPYLHVL